MVRFAVPSRTYRVDGGWAEHPGALRADPAPGLAVTAVRPQDAAADMPIIA